jgi:hypothetical protein
MPPVVARLDGVDGHPGDLPVNELDNDLVGIPVTANDHHWVGDMMPAGWAT